MLSYEEKLILFAVKHSIMQDDIESMNLPYSIIQHSLQMLTDQAKKEIAYAINSLLYQKLRNTGIFFITNYWEIPIDQFRPLDLAYKSFNKFHITTHKKLNNIVYINIKYDTTSKQFMYSSYVKKSKQLPDVSKFWTFIDLESWQLLANLLLDGNNCSYWVSECEQDVFKLTQTTYENI